MHFVWQIISGCLSTCQRLADIHIGNDRACPRCVAGNETINHLFFECPPAKQAWALSAIPSAPHVFPLESIYVNIDYLFWHAKESGCEDEAITAFPWLLCTYGRHETKKSLTTLI